jgi:TolA-binding protein
MGWYPQDEFHGRPDDWIDAEKFIERAEREHPILRENLKRLDHRAARAEQTAKQLNEQLTSVNAKVEEMSEALEAMRELNSKAEQRGRERALATIKRNAAQAAADGDAVAVGEALEQVEKLLETGQKAESAKPKEQAPAQKPGAANRSSNAATQPPPDPVAVAWASAPDREWYRTSAPMYAYANAIFEDLTERKPNMPLAEKLNEVEYEVQQRWSNSGFFAGRNITRNSAPVDSGGEVNKPRGGGSKADKTFDALPAEVKREYERVAKSYEARKGKPGYKPYQKAEFLRLYHGDTED